MFGLDDRIAELAGGSWVLAVAVALLLGLRHATDPDHLTAVSILVADDEDAGTRRARRLGLSWGLGHATTLVALGLPVVLFGAYLPEPLQHAAELAVGVVIVALALRLLLRRRRCDHVHRRPPGGVEHAHALGRTPRAAFGIGLLHGAGGSAGVSLLIVGSVAGHPDVAALCLLVLAGGAALSMALLSAAFGYALAKRSLIQRVAAATPVLGVGGLLFGLWYALAALNVAS